MYIKRAKSFRPKPVPQSAPTTTTTDSDPTTDPPPLPEQQSDLVILNRPRIVGHGTVFVGDVEQLLTKLPRTDAAVHVHMTGPFTPKEKILAVEPIRCEIKNVRKMWKNLMIYNKPLAAHCNHELDNEAMEALEKSLVHISVDGEPGDAATPVSNEQQGDHRAETASSTTPTSRPGITYIGTNLLVNELESSNNDVTNPAAADVNEDDDMPDVVQDDNDNITQEEADLEAVAQRVCSKHVFICSKHVFTRNSK
jgi:hypothetical protein